MIYQVYCGTHLWLETDSYYLACKYAYAGKTVRIKREA